MEPWPLTWKTRLSSPSPPVLLSWYMVYVGSCAQIPEVNLMCHFFNTIHLAFLYLFFETVFNYCLPGKPVSPGDPHFCLASAGVTGMQLSAWLFLSWVLETKLTHCSGRTHFLS